MQLKIRRSQKTANFTGTVIFCLDARVEFTNTERDCLTRYRLFGQVIYNSDASQRALAKSEVHQDGSFGGNFKSLAYAALAHMKLNISIASLARGQHVECKSLDELLGAENAVIEACENLKGYLDTAATFDGREVLIDFSSETPQVIAQAVSPAPTLAADPIDLGPPPGPPAPPLIEYELVDGEAVPKRNPSAAMGGPAPDSWSAHAAARRQEPADDRFGYAEPTASESPSSGPSNPADEGPALFAARRPTRTAASANAEEEIVKILAGAAAVLVVIVWALVQFG